MISRLAVTLYIKSKFQNSFQLILYNVNLISDDVVVMPFLAQLFFLLSFYELLLLSAFLGGVSVPLQMILPPGRYFFLCSNLFSTTSSFLWLKLSTSTCTVCGHSQTIVLVFRPQFGLQAG